MASKTHSPWRIVVGFGSDTGRQRQRNEDAFRVAIATEDDDREIWPDGVLAVADGMGGHDAGDVASRFIVDSLGEAFAEGGEIGEQTEEAIPARLERFFHRINAEMRALSEERGAVRGMGSTLTLTLIHRGRLYLAHVGDSRLYRLRDAKLTQITEDHSWAAEQRRKGLITAEEEANHPQKNLLTECIGVDRRINVQLLEAPLVTGDRFLLCSDGMHGPVGDLVIEEMLSSESGPQHAVDRLIELANGAGGPDNITGVVFDVALDEKLARTLPTSATSTQAETDGGADPTREIKLASPPSSPPPVEWVDQGPDDPDMTRVITTKTETGVSWLAQAIIFGGLLLILGGGGAWYLSGRDGGIKGALRTFVGLGGEETSPAPVEASGNRSSSAPAPEPAVESGVGADTLNAAVDTISLDESDP